MTILFNWQDPLSLEEQLTEEEREIRDRAKEFAEEHLLPRVTRDFREERFDRGLLAEMGKRGLLGIEIKGYGCKGASHVAYGLIAREIERIDSGYRTIFSVHSSLAMQAVNLFGSGEQKERYLPEMAKGSLIGCFGLTEPDHGSDPSSMEAAAKKVEGGYLLTGSKRWIGLAAFADLIITFAKGEEGEVLGFIVEKGDRGLESRVIEGKLSLRTAPSCEFIMEELFVPEGRRLPKAKGLKAPFSCMNLARYAIAWGALGAAESCWHAAREYSLARKQFNRPLAATQLVQKKLVEMQAEIALCLQGCLRVGRLLDGDMASHEMISLIKRSSSMKALAIAREAREILGGNGILDHYSVMRHMVNLESVITYEGTSDIHALILGRAQTGLSAFN